MKIAKLIFIFSFIVIYSVEILLFLFNPFEQKAMIDIKNTRIELAKKNNKDFDLRTPEEVYVDTKKINANLKPNFLYAKPFSVLKVFKDAKQKKAIIPFRGPINSQSLSCAEDLKYKLINNDKYGFKNNNNDYVKKINSILLGDSYAEGICEKSNNDIAGHLRKNKITTINLGITGTGPLISLAVLKEFGNKLKPQNVIYLYFEGNDLDDLNWEKKDNNLMRYLNKEYTVDYVDKINQIKLFLDEAALESEIIINSQVSNKRVSEIIEKKRTELFKEHLKDILELSNLKNIIKFNLFKKQNKAYDLELFYSIIERMNFETNQLNAKYIFVYVPTWSRYFTKYTKEISKTNLKDEILENIKNRNITTVDLTEFFDNSNDIKKYFPLGFVGHYNSIGYKKIAEIISKNVN